MASESACRYTPTGHCLASLLADVAQRCEPRSRSACTTHLHVFPICSFFLRAVRRRRSLARPQPGRTRLCLAGKTRDPRSRRSADAPCEPNCGRRLAMKAGERARIVDKANSTRRCAAKVVLETKTEFVPVARGWETQTRNEGLEATLSMSAVRLRFEAGPRFACALSGALSLSFGGPCPGCTCMCGVRPRLLGLAAAEGERSPQISSCPHPSGAARPAFCLAGFASRLYALRPLIAYAWPLQASKKRKAVAWRRRKAGPSVVCCRLELPFRTAGPRSARLAATLSSVSFFGPVR